MTGTYAVELTAMAFLGTSTGPEPFQPPNMDDKEPHVYVNKPSLICAVVITRTGSDQRHLLSHHDVGSKELFESCLDKSIENVQAMNYQNDAKSQLAPSNRMLFLLTYDIQNSNSGSITTLVHTSNSSNNSKGGGSKNLGSMPRSDDANIFDEVCVHYSDDDTNLVCTNIIEEHISKVINLNASSSKENTKHWDAKKFVKHLKVLAPPPGTVILPDLSEAGQNNVIDFVGKLSQIKPWPGANMTCVSTKIADHIDASVDDMDPITHYLNLNGPILDFKCFEDEDSDKVKVKTYTSKIHNQGTQPIPVNNNNDCYESEPQQEEIISQGIAIHCLSIPHQVRFRSDSKVTHLLPVEDKGHLLVVISSLDVEKIYNEDVSANTEGEHDKTNKDEFVDRSDTPMDTHTDAQAYFLIYKLYPVSSLNSLEDDPILCTEIPYGESPVDLCRIPSSNPKEYLFASVSIDGSLRIYSFPDFKTLVVKSDPKGPFTSVVYCTGVERLGVSTKSGTIMFYAVNTSELEAGADADDDEFGNVDIDSLMFGPAPAPPLLIANKTDLEESDLRTLVSLTGSYDYNFSVPYNAVVPGFWCELSPAQRSRFDHQIDRMWRLQNTSSTWDEHVLELTLPYSVSLAHIEFGFTLHAPCPADKLPVIQVTLFKQNVHGIGYKKDSPDLQDPNVRGDADAEPANADGSANTDDYLQAHNAEILAGPLKLSSGLDAGQQSGTLVLTSPRLYRAKGRTFLIHIKTVLDATKDINKTSVKTDECESKKSNFIGCDWLHQVSITIRSNPQTDVPAERQQRIAMLESNHFLNTLLKIATSRDDSDKRKIAMDLIIWVISIRLQRIRPNSDKTTDGNKDASSTIEAQQLECVNIIEKYVESLIRNCILGAKRSISKKCVKILLITSE